MGEVTDVPDQSTAGLDIAFSFRHGWCNLALTSSEWTSEFRASTLHDSFSKLIRAVNQLLAGNECVSVIWGGEGRGHFIDLSIDVQDGIGLVVHEMQNPRWLSPADSWTPARGPAVLEAYATAAQFCRSFGDALRQVRIEYTDVTDYMEHWGWSFPVDEYLAFERLASRKGYKPSAP